MRGSAEDRHDVGSLSESGGEVPLEEATGQEWAHEFFFFSKNSSNVFLMMFLLDLEESRTTFATAH